MMTANFSYLDFLDSPTVENVHIAHAASGLTQREAADIAKISEQTYKSWMSTRDGRSRTPAVPTWNYFIFELEARRLGKQSLKDVFTQIKPSH